ncbi:MAG: biotin--[acetyl-CoA-carboxylase] ligase [endosymbiont of Galathealinum brachiosum]|uniref:Biotin--[acetyl-CoA-carboxylase] ligase n=1 Tax=endosymbiont of Galathealinum brachiosum TaxID=2200906 RepID=A0A370DJZ7_9GAMM|nr:MAG: biotin--[acetyl-CoA-carboxylase] ligase [endosymbiont of Galathealinum brachiosum]
MAEKFKLDDKLEKGSVCKYLIEPALSKITRLLVLDTVTSTNDEVMRVLQQGVGGFVGCVTNHQSKGRGRDGKVWQSPANANVYMSIGCEFDVSQVGEVGGLSLACGVAVARLMSKIGVNVDLKWPNDILLNDKKLAGLLIETRISSSKMYVVVGLGLNIDMPESASKKIDQPWIDLLTALTAKGSNHNKSLADLELNGRNDLVAKLFNVLVECLLEYKSSGFMSFERDWNKLDLLTGRKVFIKTEDEEVEAKVLGYGNDHSLRVIINEEEKTYYAADIKLKIKKYANN